MSIRERGPEDEEHEDNLEAIENQAANSSNQETDPHSQPAATPEVIQELIEKLKLQEGPLDPESTRREELFDQMHGIVNKIDPDIWYQGSDDDRFSAVTNHNPDTVLWRAWWRYPGSQLAQALLEASVDSDVAAGRLVSAAIALRQHRVTDPALKEKYDDKFMLELYQQAVSQGNLEDAYHIAEEGARIFPHRAKASATNSSEAGTAAESLDWHNIRQDALNAWAQGSIDSFYQHAGNNGADLDRIWHRLLTDWNHVTEGHASELAQKVGRAMVTRDLMRGHTSDAHEHALEAHLPDDFVEQEQARLTKEWKENHPNVAQRIRSRLGKVGHSRKRGNQE